MIAKNLEKRDIPSPTGKGKWSREAISKLLSNEKYVGNVLLQRTMREDGYQMKNQGELDRILIRNHHPAIISVELFEVV
jgi:site-specific DNA recombinase